MEEHPEANDAFSPRPVRDAAFRLRAVRMWKASGKSAPAIARELGIKAHHLYDWDQTQRNKELRRAKLRDSDDKTQPVAEVSKENDVLKQQLSKALKERTGLRKALAILLEVGSDPD